MPPLTDRHNGAQREEEQRLKREGLQWPIGMSQVEVDPADRHQSQCLNDHQRAENHRNPHQGAMSQLSGFCDGRVRSVASAILTKSVMKTSITIPRAEMTKWPVTRNAITTNPALRIVRLILLTIQVKTRW